MATATGWMGFGDEMRKELSKSLTTLGDETGFVDEMRFGDEKRRDEARR